MENNSPKMKNENNLESNLFMKYVINNPKVFFDIIKKQKFWQPLAKDIGGEFKIVTTVARDINKLRIKYNYKGHEITLTETDTKPLFIEATINASNNSNLSVQVSENEFVERLLSKLSSKSMKLNQPSFDKKYLIKSNNKEITSNLLNGLNISESIIALEIFYLEIITNRSKNNISIVFNVNRKVNSHNYLKAVLDLYCAFIDNLISLRLINIGPRSCKYMLPCRFHSVVCIAVSLITQAQDFKLADFSL